MGRRQWRNGLAAKAAARAGLPGLAVIVVAIGCAPPGLAGAAQDEIARPACCASSAMRVAQTAPRAENVPFTAPEWRPPSGDTGMERLPAQSAPIIARVGGDGATSPGVTQHAYFVLDAPQLLTQIMTYHYGARQTPGMIALVHEDGTAYGPWQAAGAVGQGGIPNAYWWAQPNVFIKAGRYEVIDSDPATWSVEAGSEGVGIFVAWGRQLNE